MITIRIHLQSGRFRRFDVQGEIFGDWAAHKTIGDYSEYPGWQITHLPSGNAINGLVVDLDEADAKRIARALSTNAHGFVVNKITAEEGDEFVTVHDEAWSEWKYIIPAIVAEALESA